jgi:hypothetical protein
MILISLIHISDKERNFYVNIGKADTRNTGFIGAVATLGFTVCCGNIGIKVCCGNIGN